MNDCPKGDAIVQISLKISLSTSPPTPTLSKKKNFFFLVFKISSCKDLQLIRTFMLNLYLKKKVQLMH